MNAAELLAMGRAEAQRTGRPRVISLAKDAVVNLHAILFPVPIPQPATVLVVDEEFHLKGDVNWDGKIDDADLERIGNAMFSRPGDPNWDPDCDLTGGGMVDMTDLVIATVNYGSTPEHETPSDVNVVAGKCVLIATYMEQTLKETVTIKTAETLLVIFVYDVPLGLFSRSIIPPTLPMELPVM